MDKNNVLYRLLGFFLLHKTVTCVDQNDFPFVFPLPAILTEAGGAGGLRGASGGPRGIRFRLGLLWAHRCASATAVPKDCPRPGEANAGASLGIHPACLIMDQ